MNAAADASRQNLCEEDKLHDFRLLSVTAKVS